MRRKLAATGTALAMLLTAAGSAFAYDDSDSGDSRPGDFDFYVLSLSWSPSYCAAEGPRANAQQCGLRRPFGFVAHGLWPQDERGYPSGCSFDPSRGRGSYVPRGIVSGMSDIMPSTGLVVHEWRKHGSCSGLSQSDFFATLRRAYQQVSIPANLRSLSGDRQVDPMQVERAFIAANPGLTPDGSSVTCRRNYLQEVRICMTKDLDFRACPEIDRQSCGKAKTVMPPVRGG